MSKPWRAGGVASPAVQLLGLGVLLMTAYRKYYEPSTLYLKQLIQSGKLGRIDIIHTAFSELYVPGVSQSWLLERRTHG